MPRPLLWIPAGTTGLLFGLSFVPRIADSPGARTAVWAACGVFFIWQVLLRLRGGAPLRLRWVPVRSHWVQACVQFSIYLYWGWYWRPVYHFLPLLLAQIVFLYTFDMLLQWSRRREWILGFGPLPITFSTNFFLWYHDEWFLLQFLQLAVGSLGKEFVRWKRDGRSCHIFNPSAFSLTVSSVFLLATGSSGITWGEEIATTFGRPDHIYAWVFAAGLIVQGLFQVTLVTFGAVLSMFALNAVYTGSTGVYFFFDSNIPAAVFLGLHLLVTDPATSPRTMTGKALFGLLYGLLVFPLYWILGSFGAPTFYDKLLSVPLLNLSVKWIDAATRFPFVQRLRDGVSVAPARLNAIHMAFWIAFFLSLLANKWVGRGHPGADIAFWKQACEEGRPSGCRRYLNMLSTMGEEGNAGACNELGTIFMEGKLVPPDLGRGLDYFERACELGSDKGCTNVAIQFLFHQRGQGFDERIATALARLESACESGDAMSCYLVGYAYLTGAGVDADPERGHELLELACAQGLQDACELARATPAGPPPARRDQ